MFLDRRPVQNRVVAVQGQYLQLRSSRSSSMGIGAARRVDSTLAFERVTTNERIGDKGMTVMANGDERNPA
ncbi:hypothetical protein Taro_014457 [Colocasia esculenta]|uniref:Uncharacterized protein n=1 Tax=Colocasia esculenta TaxID=4460 RepID=A0A843UI80_COLES|nr:hypothetical protein [Colocasia esculenta]